VFIVLKPFFKTARVTLAIVAVGKVAEQLKMLNEGMNLRKTTHA
jgi:hypothetical protein